MSIPKLTYYNIEGRGEVARLCFGKGGIDFEDNRISFPDWPAVKPTMPYGKMPVLEIEGHTLTQSNAINRFLGKRVGLYPTEEFAQAKCDQVPSCEFVSRLMLTRVRSAQIMECVEDFLHPFLDTFGLPPDEVMAKRAVLVEKTIPYFFERFERELQAGGGKFFTGALTVADLKVCGNTLVDGCVLIGMRRCTKCCACSPAAAWTTSRPTS
jgi:glutathione S-transferase